ncbi:hypothetical protein GCM10010483_06030 [Actinokineospora diospyrosa]
MAVGEVGKFVDVRPGSVAPEEVITRLIAQCESELVPTRLRTTALAQLGFR